MNEFWTTVLTFPTLPWSILLSFCLIYWLSAALGIFDLGHHVDGWADADIGDMVDGAQPPHAHHHHGGDEAAGLLSRLGLAGVPFMVMLLAVSFFGWIASYYIQLLFLGPNSGLAGWLLAIGACIGSVFLAIICAAVVLRPVRKWLVKLQPPGPASLLGRVGTIVSPVVDSNQGRAEFPDGGAGLLLQVRAPEGESYLRGTSVVLIGRDKLGQDYKVMSYEEFTKK